MSQLQLLDCTLRDGGYVNDWKFGHENLVSIFERLVDAGVDIIEIGFLDERRPFDIDRSIMPDTESVGKIYGSLKRNGAKIVGMIDFGTCGLEQLQPASESYLDGIRVIFKKHLMKPAMEFCRQVKNLGYQVFAQLVSVTAYSDAELLDLIALVNDVKPYAVSMVDTYGLLHPSELLHIFEILDANVCPEVKIGFHAHNNFQLAYANVLAILEHQRHHAILVDGTLYGMGKSAGNAPLELIAMRLNEQYGKQYQIDSMLEAIEESIMGFYERNPWGYKEFFYLCAKNKCHPNYLTYFDGKHNFSTTKIDRMLAEIEPQEKKLLYDKEVAEALYQRFCTEVYSDTHDRLAFVRETAGRKLLLIGPGKNIGLQAEKVKQFAAEKHPYCISINYLPQLLSVDCVFVTNGKRYHDMTLSLMKMQEHKPKFLATSNVECRSGQFDFVVRREPLLESNESIIDNSFLMLLKFLRSIDVTEVFCAGFDGYSDKEDNYCNPAMEYGFVKQQAVHLNRHMKEAIAVFRQKMQITFLTYSAYDEVEDIGSASI